jgi:DNA-binding CsgD family transcriptional regulator
MESLLKNVARFAMLLTRNPSTEDLLNALMRDFLIRYSVTAIEIQVLGSEGTLVIKKSVGQPIEGNEAKNVASLSQLVAHSNIFGDLEESGVIFDPAHNLSVASINLDSSIKGFYLFQHASVFTPDENSSDQFEVFVNLMTVYLSAKLLRMSVAKTLTSPASLDHISMLTARQLLILAGMVEGKTNHELSVELGFSVSTIRHETMAIYKELGVSDRKEAARVGQAEHLI